MDVSAADPFPSHTFLPENGSISDGAQFRSPSAYVLWQIQRIRQLLCSVSIIIPVPKIIACKLHHPRSPVLPKWDRTPCFLPVINLPRWQNVPGASTHKCIPVSVRLIPGVKSGVLIFCLTIFSAFTSPSSVSYGAFSVSKRPLFADSRLRFYFFRQIVQIHPAVHLFFQKSFFFLFFLYDAVQSRIIAGRVLHLLLQIRDCLFQRRDIILDRLPSFCCLANLSFFSRWRPRFLSFAVSAASDVPAPEASPVFGPLPCS